MYNNNVVTQQVITYSNILKKEKFMEEQVGTTDNRPAISPEEFAELRNMQGQQTFLQSQGYQAYAFLKQLDAQFEEIKQNYTNQRAQAEEQLGKVEAELTNSNNLFQERFKEIISGYGFDGATAVNIEENEPHYISEVAPQADPIAPADDFIPTEE